MDDDEWIDVTDQYVQPPEEDEWVDVTSQFVEPMPSPDEPGWGETISTNIGTGAANIIGGAGSLVDSLPGFDFGFGDWIKSTAEPYQRGGAEFNPKLPVDSWEISTLDVTQGLASSMPIIPLVAGAIVGMVAAFGVRRHGPTSNSVEWPGLE